MREKKCNNSKQYDELLLESAYLRRLETYLIPQQVQTVKRLAFNQNLYVEKDNWEQRVLLLPSWEDMPEARENFRQEAACVKAFLTSVAHANNISVEFMCHELYNIVNNVNHKKRTLLLYGKSDTGKSLMGNLLTSVFKTFEIGSIACPTSNHTSVFWLQDCIGKQVYRMEEMVIEFQGVLQRIKQLMEGSKELDTNVKYGDNKKIVPKPVIITMNTNYEWEIVGPFQDELEPFLNRCFYLKMSQSLKDYIPKRLFNVLGNAGKVFNAFVYSLSLIHI